MPGHDGLLGVTLLDEVRRTDAYRRITSIVPFGAGRSLAAPYRAICARYDGERVCF
jgi:hypothetical protein